MIFARRRGDTRLKGDWSSDVCSSELDTKICDTWQREELQVAKRRVNKYPKAFRLMAVERMKNCDNVSALARELGVDRSVLYHWRDLLPGQGEGGSTATSPVRELRKEIRDLKRVLAEKAL